MAGPDRRSSAGIDRRASMRHSMDQQREHDNDEYDLEAMGISDGFNPSNVAMTQGNRVAPMVEQQRIPPRPSSTAKPPTGIDSFALRHDGAMGADVRRMSANVSNMNAIPSRPVSTASETPHVRPESPYRGPSGPSHPYQMYPQESRLARTASIATTSTAPVVERERERSYAGPSGPTHPYGMYPQNIVPEAETNQAPTVTTVPVGFPGSNNNYQRRLGPDGEEIAGIIGPDGHTEELPPYTKYPDEAFARKTRPNVAVDVPNAASVPIVQVAQAIPGATIPNPTMSGAGGIGLATRNPEFASQENLNSPSRGSIMSEASHHPVNTAAVSAAEKPPLKKWQRKARKQVCGIIPVWVFVLLAIVFVLFGVILGTVLTLLKPPNKHPKDQHNRDGPQAEGANNGYTGTSMTTTYDATPLTAVPTGLPALPTGTFAIPIGPPSLNLATCLQNTVQSNAWSCSVGMGPGPVQMTVKAINDSPSLVDNNEIILDYGNQSLKAWTYGAQAPTFPQEQVMHLVKDADELSRGPAWWFQMPYNKLVILKEGDLAAVSKRGSTGDRHETADFGSRKGVASPGEQVWFCYWNGTVLEAFIYPNQTSSFGANNPITSSASPSRTTSTSNSGSATYSSVPTASGYPPPSGSGPPPYGQQQMNMIPPYGKVIKIQEHRISSGPQVVPPYCMKYTINSDNSATPSLNSTKQPIMVYLNETEATSFTKRSPLNHKERHEAVAEREIGSGNKCGCVWLYT